MFLIKMVARHVPVTLVLLEFLKLNVSSNLVHFKPLSVLKQQLVLMIIVEVVMLTIMMRMEMRFVSPNPNVDLFVISIVSTVMCLMKMVVPHVLVILVLLEFLRPCV